MQDCPSSQHAERFNHDRQARGYDADVADESNPIRAGYSAALEWVADRCNRAAPAELLELGCGTGNLTRVLNAGSITAVDISSEMMAVAAGKLAGCDRVRFVNADAMSFVGAAASGAFDVVASTYALHHLTDPEKSQLLGRLTEIIRGGGCLAVADLMFADAAERTKIIDGLTISGLRGLVDAIQEEFFWDVAATTGRLHELGFTVECERISTLTWGILARR